MAKQSLNHLDVHAGLQCERRRTVPKVMQADRRQPGLPDQLAEPVGDRRRVQLGAVLPREDPAAVRPRRAPLHPLGELLTPPRAQHLHCLGVELYGAVACVALRRVRLDFPAELGQLLGDGQLARVEIDVDPPDAARFAAAQAPERDQVVQRVEAFVGRVVEELAGLFGGPHHHR